MKSFPCDLGPGKLCINVNRQTWAFGLPPKEDFRTLLGLFTALSFYENHVNTTETLGKGQKTLCKGFTYKNFTYTPVCWDKCQAKSGKLMFVANHTIVDWGPHDKWWSSCSEEVNSMVCDCYASDMEGHWHYDGALPWHRTSWVAWPWISPTSS